MCSHISRLLISVLTQFLLSSANAQHSSLHSFGLPMIQTLPTGGKLPIIDVAPFLDSATPDDKRAATTAALHSACLDYGFFYLNIDAYVDRSEAENLARLARAFFSLPQEEKDKLSLANQDFARGYAKLNENITNGKADAHEGLDFYKPVPVPDKTKPLWGENQWPTIHEFKQKYELWVEKMKKLGLIIMEAMSEGLGLSREEWQNLRSQVDNSFWVMRVIGYPPLPKDNEGISCGAHKDYGCLTFLWADPTPSALQVFFPDVKRPKTDHRYLSGEQESGVWLDADPIPGCIVCNIGEMWEVWTNGLYRSTLHRVIHRGSNYRISIPFFFEPNFDALVKPLNIPDKNNNTEDIRDAVVYGDFLLKKVGSNFAFGGTKSKYSSDTV